MRPYKICVHLRVTSHFTLPPQAAGRIRGIMTHLYLLSPYFSTVRYQHIQIPASGEKISIVNHRLNVPDEPILGYVEGDGIGPDITAACLRVWDAAVACAYGGKRRVHWCELFMGEKAAGIYAGDYFPAETLYHRPNRCIHNNDNGDDDDDGSNGSRIDDLPKPV